MGIKQKLRLSLIFDNLKQKCDSISTVSETKGDEMVYNKVTNGFVIQTFDDDGKLLAQEFIAEDSCSWENDYGEPLPEEDAPNFYHPFEMKLDVNDGVLMTAKGDEK